MDKTTCCKKCGAPRELYKRCKPCNSEWFQEWYQKNPEYQKKRREKDPAKARAYQREWYAKNRERVVTKKAAWRAAHPGYADQFRDPERDRENARRWKKNNPEKARANSNNWKKRHPDKVLAYDRANIPRQRSKYHKRRSAKLGSPGHYTAADWESIVARQDGKCADCGLRRNLTVDHKIPISKGGSNMALNIQGLCLSCNSRKSDFLDPNIPISLFDRVVAA